MILNNNYLKVITHPITQNFIMDDFFGESVFDEGI